MQSQELIATRPANTPYVNLNGSSRKALCDGRIALWRALKDAMKALGETCPNGRDYQTAPRGAYEAARAAYVAQFAALDKMANEVHDVIAFLMDEGAAA